MEKSGAWLSHRNELVREWIMTSDDNETNDIAPEDKEE